MVRVSSPVAVSHATTRPRSVIASAKSSVHSNTPARASRPSGVMAVCPIWHTQSVNGCSSPNRSRPSSRSRMRAVLRAVSYRLGDRGPVPRGSPHVGGHVEVHCAQHSAGAGQVECDGRPVAAGGPQHAARRPAQLDAEHHAAVSLQGPRVGQRAGVVDVDDLVLCDSDLTAPGEEDHLRDLAVDPLRPADRPPLGVTELEVRRLDTARRGLGGDESAHRTRRPPRSTRAGPVGVRYVRSSTRVCFSPCTWAAIPPSRRPQL